MHQRARKGLISRDGTQVFKLAWQPFGGPSSDCNPSLCSECVRAFLHPQKPVDPLELELQTIVSCHVAPGT